MRGPRGRLWALLLGAASVLTSGVFRPAPVWATVDTASATLPSLSPPWAGARYAVVIGNNVGRDPSRRLRFAEQDAEKIHRILRQRGAFPAERTRLLLGRDANQVWDEMLRIERQIARHARYSGRKTLLLLYYSGHADGDELQLGGTTLSFARLTDFLKRSGATVRLAIVDACRSGTLASSKAARFVDGRRIHLMDQLASAGYAIITSSGGDELSQESQEIRGSFFTHYLVSALHGAADRSGDGRVTLDEAYDYAYAQTVARTSRSIAGPQHPMYKFRLSGKGSVVLAAPRAPLGRLGVRAPRGGGRLLVMDHSRSRLLAEAVATTGQPASLTVPAGRYVIYHLQPRRLRVARVAVAARGTTLVDSEMFVEERLSRSLAKGGLFRSSWGHQLDTSFLLRRWPLEGGGLSYGAAVQYRAEGPSGWSPTIRLTTTAAPDTHTSTDYLDLGITAGVGWRSAPLSWVTLRCEALAGYEHLRQSRREQRARHSSALAYLGQVGAQVPLFPLTLSATFGVGGRLLQVSEAGRVHRLDLQWTIGAGLGWE